MKRTIIIAALLFANCLLPTANCFSQTYQWAFSIGDTASDLAMSLDLDASNNVYVAGSFTSTVDFDPGVGIVSLTGAAILTAVDSAEIFLAKYGSSGAYSPGKFKRGNLEQYF